jgi:hypothetical protein
VCCVVGQNDTFFDVTTERNILGVVGFRIGISGGLCEYSTGICEHGTVTVAGFYEHGAGSTADYVNTILDQ